MQVCSALESKLGNRATMGHLVGVLMQSIERGMPSDGRKHLVDVLVRIGLSMKDVNTSKICFDSIIDPFVNDLKSKLQKYGTVRPNTEAAVDLVGGIANNLGILYAGTKHLDRLNSQKTQQIAGNFVQTMWPILNALVKGFFNYSNILRSSFDLMSRIVRSFGVVGNGGTTCRVNGAAKGSVQASRVAPRNYYRGHAAGAVSQNAFASLRRLFIICVCQYRQQSVCRCQLLPTDHNGVV